jgi:NAD(P)-dependent dehydrogenase (short-subunit alcohol dehydrogenase family)
VNTDCPVVRLGWTKKPKNADKTTAKSSGFSPGWIETKNYSGLRRKDHKQHPAGRVGRPEDVAEIVSWLLDGKRSGFVVA